MQPLGGVNEFVSLQVSGDPFFVNGFFAVDFLIGGDQRVKLVEKIGLCLLGFRFRKEIK